MHNLAITIVLELALIAVAYVSFSVFAQRRLSNYKRIKEIRTEMNVKMKELKELGKEVSQDVMALKQKEIMALTSEQMKHQMKSTFIILPVSVLIFYIILPMAFPSQPSVSVLSYTLSYRTFFIVIAFVLGLLSTGLLALYDRVAAKRQPKPVPVQ